MTGRAPGALSLAPKKGNAMVMGERIEYVTDLTSDAKARVAKLPPHDHLSELNFELLTRK